MIALMTHAMRGTIYYLLMVKYLWIVAAICSIALVGAVVSYINVLDSERQMANRYTDSTGWMSAKFDSELRGLTLGLAMYDGTAQKIDVIRDMYDVVYGRINVIRRSKITPIPPPEFITAFSELTDEIYALESRVAALKPDDVEAAHLLAAELAPWVSKASYLASLSLQQDGLARRELAGVVTRANVGFGIAAVVLIGSVTMLARALVRQAAVLRVARKELRFALDRAEAGVRAKSAFLATMSHEIRTPMNGVLGAASLLAHTTLTDAQRRSVDIVTLCGEALMSQLDDVLDFSALEAQSVVLHPESVDVRELVRASARVVEIAAAQKRLDVIVLVDHDIPRAVQLDQRRMRQVLINLITNAVKFTTSGGVVVRLSLRHWRSTAFLRIAVIDTGPGIPFTDRRRIFDEFIRLERQIEDGARGTGLGLAICQRIVAAMGGNLKVAKVPGGGSAFMFRVPIGLPVEAISPSPPEPRGAASVLCDVILVRRAIERMLMDLGYAIIPVAARPDLVMAHVSVDMASIPPAARVVAFGPDSGNERVLGEYAVRALIDGKPRAAEALPQALPHETLPLRLLVADDDPINREVEAGLLRHLGHAVTTVADGSAALVEVTSQRFDCLLLDRHMPGLNGVQLAVAIRAMPEQTARVRMVAVTADINTETRMELISAGFDAILSKPVTLERLAGALKPPVAAGNRAFECGQQVEPRGIVDIEARKMLLTGVPQDRFVALVCTFWVDVAETCDVGRAGFDNRVLHTMAGSSASLGYTAVSTLARQCRAKLQEQDEFLALFSKLLIALLAASKADAALLPPELATRLAHTIDRSAVRTLNKETA